MKKLGAKNPDTLAWSAIAEMAGALALSRTLSDPERSTGGIDRSTGPADMSASCRRVGVVVRHREPDRVTSPDVTRPSAVPPPLGDGTAVAYTLAMSATRYRDGRLSIFLLAGFFALALGSDAAWPAVAGSHAGGHVGEFGGGGRLGTGVPRGGKFGGGRFVGRRFGDHRFAHGQHGRRGFFPYLGAYPYGDEYDLDYGYDPHYSYNPYPSGYPNAGHCDVSSHSYPQYCVWKDGP